MIHLPPQTWNLWQCTKMVKSDKNHPHPRSFWHERAVLQRSAFGQWTAGNEVVANILISLFSTFLHSSLLPFLIEGVLGSKNLFSESWPERPKSSGYTPFQTPSAILGPPGGHFGFQLKWRNDLIVKLIYVLVMRSIAYQSVNVIGYRYLYWISERMLCANSSILGLDKNIYEFQILLTNTDSVLN